MISDEDKKRAFIFWGSRNNGKISKLIKDEELLNDDWHVWIDDRWVRVADIDFSKYEKDSSIIFTGKSYKILTKDPHGYIRGFVTVLKIIGGVLLIVIATFILLGIHKLWEK